MTGLEKFKANLLSDDSIDKIMVKMCPSDFGLTRECVTGKCTECWEKALREEYEE